MSPSTSFSGSFIITCLLLIITWAIWQMWKKSRKLPPGPYGLPLLGWYPFLNKTHLDLLDLGKKYGNVCSFRTVGGRLIIVLNGAKVIKDVLVSRADEFDGRPKGNNLVNWISDGLGIAQEDGDSWKEQRRFWLQTAKSLGYGKQETEHLIQEQIEEMLQQFRKSSGKSVDHHISLAFAASSIISLTLFGVKQQFACFEEVLNPLEKMLSLFLGKRHLLIGRAFDLIMKFSSDSEETKNGKMSYQNKMNSIVQEQVQSFDPHHSRGYVDEYLKTRKELLNKGVADAGTFTMERLRSIIQNMFMEGTESVSGTIYSMLRELSKHAEVQRQMQTELDSVVGRERLPSWSDRQKTPYVDAVVQELYRTALLFLVTTVYSNFEETTINGFLIPKRSMIVSNLYSIHFDPENYPDPQKFDPGRFLSEDGRRIKREGPYPFGLGKRACIGESMAQMEVYLFISSILQSFSLEPGNSEGTLKIISRA